MIERACECRDQGDLGRFSKPNKTTAIVKSSLANRGVNHTGLRIGLPTAATDAAPPNRPGSCRNLNSGLSNAMPSNAMQVRCSSVRSTSSSELARQLRRLSRGLFLRLQSATVPRRVARAIPVLGLHDDTFFPDDPQGPGGCIYIAGCHSCHWSLCGPAE